VITSKWFGIGCKLLLITNRKSHMGFLSVTLNVIMMSFCIFVTEWHDFWISLHQTDYR